MVELREKRRIHFSACSSATLCLLTNATFDESDFPPLSMLATLASTSGKKFDALLPNISTGSN